MERGNNYYAYLLRLWRENEEAPWRVSLQDSQTGEKIGFADLSKLTVFLEEQIEGKVIIP